MPKEQLNTNEEILAGSLKQVNSAGYSVTVKIKIKNIPGQLGPIIQVLGALRASLAEIALLYSDFHYNIREFTINCKSEAHSIEVVEALKKLDRIAVIDWRDDTFELHRGGKLEIATKAEIRTRDQLSRAYTPGVARICTAIHENPKLVYDYTIKGHTVAVVTDGSAVLGLGNIGPAAAMPVMEGKAVLFKQYGGIDAIPICLDTQNPEEVIKAVKYLAPAFGGINLEDIAAPNCFEVEERLRKELDIPVFHDDQHGTAAVVLAGLFNALKIVNKNIGDLKVVVNGFGAGGVACTRMLLSAGIKNIIPCDSVGIVYRGRTERMNAVKEKLLEVTNLDSLKGSVADAVRGADVFIGVSQPNSLTRAMVQTMAKAPIIFALANPTPEIFPEEIQDIAPIIATGRSDYANQVNNVLCFPGIFRGAFEAKATDITDGMKLAAAKAIAEGVSEDELSPEYIIPSVFRANIADAVATAVANAARKEGVVRG